MQPRLLPSKAFLFRSLFLVYFIWRLFLLRHRYFDTDELEHLHAAFCIAHGGVPYKHFFELHPPLLWFVLAPWVKLCRQPLRMVWVGRLFVFICVIGIFKAQKLLSRTPNHPSFEWLSLLLLASFTTFAAKSLEIRPDVPAALCLSALYLLISRDLTPHRAFWAGLALTASIFFSFKAIYPAAGFLAGGAIETFFLKEEKSVILKSFLFFVIGVTLLPSVFLIYVHLHHAWEATYSCLYVFNKSFRGGFPASFLFRSSWKENIFLWSLAGVGVVFQREYLGLKLAFWACFVSLWMTPSSYLQSYILLGPLLGLFAARGWEKLFEAGGAKDLAFKFIVWGGALLLLPSFVYQAIAARPTNDQQLDVMRCVDSNTNTSDVILDTWTGLSFFRPHATYFWFFPDDIRGALGTPLVDKTLESGLLSPNCRGVIYDNAHFGKQSPAVLSMVKAHYHASNCRFLYLRNEE